MKPTPTILLGAPLSGEEASFLRTLYADLAGVDYLILSNFVVKERQIDFVVITQAYAAILELKNFSRPIFGQQNGTWAYLNTAGERVHYAGPNPWQQTLAQKHALSDEMRRYQEKNTNIPAPSGRAYYSDFVAFVCIYPQIHAESQVTAGDYKVGVRSYQEVIQIIRGQSKSSTWGLAEWRLFAQHHLNLTAATIDTATDPRIDQATEKLEAYRARICTV